MKSPDNMLRAAVEGYVSGGRSFVAGETVKVHCSSERPAFDVQIARRGANRHVVWAASGLPGRHHDVPDDVGARGCGWPPSFEVEVSPDWAPGYYEVRFNWPDKSLDELDQPAFFVVRSAEPAGSRPATLMLITDTTYNAYNDWNHSLSLYTGGVRVSWERPFAPGFLSRPPDIKLRAATAMGVYDPDFRDQRETVDAYRLSGWCYGSGFHQWERPFVSWAEREGFELDFAVSSDLELRPEILEGRRLVVSVGHDEYWSAGMRDSIERYIAEGGNAAFLTGNAVFWQVRLEDGGRAMTCYKYAAPNDDPERGTPLQSGMWSDHVVGRPENHLTGVSFTRGGYVRAGQATPRGPGGYLVWRPDHWVFEGTDLRYGDLLGAKHGVVGYEADGCELTYGEDGLPAATHADGTPDSFEVLATSPARLWAKADLPPTTEGVDGGMSDLGYTQWRVLGIEPDRLERDLDPAAERLGHGNAVMGVYTRGGTVFTSGCTDWVHGLEGRDPLVTRITHNLLTRLGGDGA
ncbi:hypothetical protein KVF89_02170 [Nocardioides carbamazepini]|uniref:N,N-dimethylformamidase beta subunit family domain-containing protein n=1 Tax=Nocardioides carbamazepini TaxID=2854259 RepID=UPI002149A528|nr:N,N-dimethylformamidase beta subunit family domain-containing protein [Nocardioides carbamazepini]MCR1781327.1 hypothetical protein [Nocardioides carbamazepini]